VSPVPDYLLQGLLGDSGVNVSAALIGLCQLRLVKKRAGRPYVLGNWQIDDDRVLTVEDCLSPENSGQHVMHVTRTQEWERIPAWNDTLVTIGSSAEAQEREPVPVGFGYALPFGERGVLLGPDRWSPNDLFGAKVYTLTAAGLKEAEALLARIIQDPSKRRPPKGRGKPGRPHVNQLRHDRIIAA
jgi:hypothetical protein